MPQTVAPSKGKRARWTDDELMELTTRVRNGEKLRDVAQSLGKSYSSAHSRLREIERTEGGADDAASAPSPRAKRKAKKAAPKAKATRPKPARSAVPAEGAGFVSTLRKELAAIETKADGIRSLLNTYEGGADW